MKKINIRVSIISSSSKKINKIGATIEKNQYIYYVEKDAMKTVNIYNLQKDTLERDNDDIYLYLNFIEKKHTIGIMTLKDIYKTIDLDIYTNKIIKNKKGIKIEYVLNDEKYKYKIEYRE